MTPSVTEFPSNPTFGPSLYGAELHINDTDFTYYEYGDTLVIDVETDEKDNFVGLAFTKDGKRIDYVSFGIDYGVIDILLTTGKLIGHNIKGDIKWLKSWGVNIKSNNLYYDTILASYVQNTTKESHGLKDLAKEYLGMEWPTYKQMVGSGKKKVTLDKQEVGRVAAYCGTDCLATYRLWKYFEKKLTIDQKRYLETIELPTARALLDMELRGVRVDVEYLTNLDKEFGITLVDIMVDVHEQWKNLYTTTPFNINSNRDVANLLIGQGATLPKTPKGNYKVDRPTLEKLNVEAVPLLLEYSKIEKLKGTYTEALLEKQKDGRIYCSFNQISKNDKGDSFGISTGRLSSSNPNLQNIPTRTEEGKTIRQVFIPEHRSIFLDADYSQIEPRLVAHFTKDKTFIDTYLNDRDIYSELVAGTGRDRQDGKTFMLALLYGAQPKKLASVFKCTELEAQEIINKIMRKLPGVRAWIERTKYEAKRKGGIYTLFKRWIPLPRINSLDRYEKMHWERVAVNSIIQGSAAEIMKLALIKLTEAGYKSVLTVHDEFLIEDEGLNKEEVSSHASVVKHIMETIVKLAVPLKVDIGIGRTWKECKK